MLVASYVSLACELVQSNGNENKQTCQNILKKFEEHQAEFAKVAKLFQDNVARNDEKLIDNAIELFEKMNCDFRQLIYCCSGMNASDIQANRLLIVDSCVKYFKTLSCIIDRNHDFSIKAYLNMAPKGHYRSGIAPEHIKEPAIRKDYEERLANNAKLVAERSIHGALKDAMPSVSKNLNDLIAKLYSGIPRTDNELVELLEKYDYPEEEKVKILKELGIPYRGLREWQSKDGTMKVIGRFVSLAGSDVMLETKDKKRQNVTLSNLREEDQEYVKEQNESEPK